MRFDRVFEVALHGILHRAGNLLSLLDNFTLPALEDDDDIEWS